jgi:hypothetical protein
VKVAVGVLPGCLAGIETRSRGQEVLPVSGAVSEELAAAFELEAVLEVLILVPARLVFGGPALEIRRLLALRLGEQVVADAHRHLALAHDLQAPRVVLGKGMAAAARVHRAGHAQPIHLAVEVQGRVDLVLRRQLRRPGDHLVQDQRVRFGMQDRPAVDELVASALRRGSLLADAQRPHRGAVDQALAVQGAEVGVSGAASFSSFTVGIRFSAN